MQNETRVNLKHLLEDIRDGYRAPLEEVIVTELIANALDSKATRLDFMVRPEAQFLRCTDNGVGMKRQALREYHNIAASAKVRGTGIGFAGVGAKLALLLAEKVVTESKGGHGSRAASEWRLSGPYRAPWKFVPTLDAVPYPRGTSVSIYFSDRDTHLLKPEFVTETVLKHFYPLLSDYLREEILRFVYRKGVEITVNGELLCLSEAEQRIDHGFRVFQGGARKPIGAGFLTKRVLEGGWLAKLAGRAPNERRIESGLSISTYGKIIKSGWEWLGIMPRNAELLCGAVEIPLFSELLTTNKSDFLGDGAHLKKYYRLRKAIQQAVLPVLRSLGEYASVDRPSATKNIKPLIRQIETALEQVADEFPELQTILGFRRAVVGGAAKKQGKKERQGAHMETESPAPKQSPSPRLHGASPESDEPKGKGGDGRKIVKKPGLSLLLEDLADAPESLGCIIEDTISINTLHPVWRKALATKQEEYHILVVVGLVLADFVAPEKHPQEFLAKFLSSWSTVGAGETERSGQASLL